jgi:hypothetical protein
MQGTTLAIGILGSILVLLLRPAYALGAYFAVLVWYPDYLRVSIGTLDISAGRIVVTVLLLRCLLNDRLRRKFVWSRLDTWVALSMLVYVVMYCITRPLQESLENRSGFLMDTWLVYITARLCITDRAEVATFVKSIAVILVTLAILGIAEAVTVHHYFRWLKRFRVWNTPLGETVVEGRFGFGRGTGPFSHSIMFGSCFVMFLPLIWALRRQRDYWGELAYPLSGMIILGALSSMSSGPWVMLMAVALCLVLERYKRWTKPLLIALAVFCVLIAVASNRPFYHVIVSYANPLGGAGWQRAKLIDCAIEDFGDWWLAGYGTREVPWGRQTGMGHTDCNNEFILAGIRYGMLGVIALAGTLAMAFRSLVRAFKETTDKELRSLYWAMGCALVGVIVIWQGVSFFGTPAALFYCLLGTIGSSFGFTKRVTSEDRSVQGVSNDDLVLLYRGQ